MVTSGVIFAFVGSILFTFANSAAIDYEPIKIIVNENFNAQPGQDSSGLQALEPGVLHQGANFYFKPQVNLPQSFIPSHLEALISFIQQHQYSDFKDASKFAAEKDKLMEILKPFMNPSSDISKETPSKIDFEKENNLDILKPPVFIPSALEEIVAEPQPVPVIITEDPKLATELSVIPEAPVLPPLSLNSVHSLTEEEVKNDKSTILEEQTGVYSIIPEITVQPIQEPIYNYVQAITEAQRGVFPTISGIALRPIQESIIKYNDSKMATSEIGAIPEAPVLAQTDKSNPEETIIIYVEPKPILVEEGVKIEEPIVFDVESKPASEELEELIPEPPVLSPVVLQDVPSIIKEESIILKEPTDLFPVIPEIAVRPVQEPILNYVELKPLVTEFQTIPEAPILPPLSASYIKLIEEGMKIKKPIVIQVESKPDIHELEKVISEAPALPPLSLHDVPYIVKEEVRKEESELLNEPTVVFPTVSEVGVRPVQEPIFDYVEPKPFVTEFYDIPEAPVLPPLSANDITLVEEGMKIEEPIVVEIESKPAIQEFEKVIPEAPVLPPLSLHDVTYIVKEEVRKEESELLNEPTVVFPIVSEAVIRPQEPIFNYIEPKPFITEFQDIPEAPVLPPLSASDIKLVEESMKIEEPIVFDVESKPAIEVLEEVISPLVLQDVPSIINEESVIIKEPTGVLTTVPEAVAGPVQEPIFSYTEPKPFFTVLQNIPEAPVLPPLSGNEIKLVEEGMKIEEPIVVDVESKPAILGLEKIIPEAPTLSPLSFHDVPFIVKEGVRKEKSELPNEPTVVFPTVLEAAVRPQELIFNYVEPKPFISELQVIPEAPGVLPPLSANDIKLVEEGIKIEEPIVIDVKSKPTIQELEEVIPEAPVLPPLSLHDVPYIVKEEVRKEESELLKEPSVVFPTVSEVAVRPVQEPIFDYVEPKPLVTKFQAIPEAPLLPPLSANDIKLVEEGMKIEEPIVVDVESKPVIEELEEVIPEAPALSFNGLPALEVEVKTEELVKAEESTDMFPEDMFQEISARPISGPITVSESGKHFALENNNSPVATKVNIEIPILLEESIEVFPPFAERPLEPTLEPVRTNSYVLEEVSQPKPEYMVPVKETLPPTIFPKPSNNLRAFNYAPFVTHFSNHATKAKKLTIPKPAFLERFLLKKNQFRLPVMFFPKLSLNAMKSSIMENKKQFVYPTSYAHDVVEKRIAPNMGLKNYAPPKLVRIYMRSQVPKEPSYL